MLKGFLFVYCFHCVFCLNVCVYFLRVENTRGSLQVTLAVLTAAGC